VACGHTPDPSRPRQLEYEGLGDDPTAYVLSEKNRQLLVTDEAPTAPRAARDHRRLLRPRAEAVAAETATQHDERLAELHQAVRANRHRHRDHNGALLGSLLLVLGEIAPVPAALLLFARGAAGIHHTWRVQRVARDLSRRDDARDVLRDIHRRIDQFPPEEREAMIELLLEHH
jgi:hypothetical protein